MEQLLEGFKGGEHPIFSTPNLFWGTNLCLNIVQPNFDGPQPRCSHLFLAFPKQNLLENLKIAGQLPQRKVKLVYPHFYEVRKTSVLSTYEAS